MSTLRTILLFILGACLTGCAATGPTMSEVRSSMPELSADQGRIFFYRTKSFFGGAVSADLRLNGDVVGRSALGTFFYVDRPAGQYEVASSTETEKKLTFALGAGEMKYVRTYVGMGLLVGRVIPELVDGDKAGKEIEDLAYVESPRK